MSRVLSKLCKDFFTELSASENTLAKLMSTYASSEKIMLAIDMEELKNTLLSSVAEDNDPNEMLAAFTNGFINHKLIFN